MNLKRRKETPQATLRAHLGAPPQMRGLDLGEHLFMDAMKRDSRGASGMGTKKNGLVSEAVFSYSGGEGGIRTHGRGTPYA